VRKVALLPVIGLALLLGLLPGCGEKMPVTHFNSEGISFDYPAAWKGRFDPFAVAFLGQPGTDTAVKVLTREMPFLTVQVYHDDLVRSLSGGEAESTRSLGVAGAIGYESIFNANSEGAEVRMRLITFEKEGVFCDIYLFAAPAAFNGAQRAFDIIVNSFDLT